MFEKLRRFLGIDRLNGEVNTAAPDESYALSPRVEDPLADVYYWMDANKKVNAIKAYREATGVGLKEAKAFVDGLEQAS